MKKLILFCIIFYFATSVKAQFLNSMGVTIGGSAGKEKFFFHNPDEISKKNFILGLNASVFAEFFSDDYARWVSEIQFNQKGCIDKQPDNNYRNRLNYLCWNNYLKVRYEMFRIIPYFLIGPRLEYKLTQNTSSPVIIDSFRALHVSGAIGAGTEFISYSNFVFFIEGFYNPDIMKAYKTEPLNIKNKNIELRIGLKYEFAGKDKSCNTPTYIED